MGYFNFFFEYLHNMTASRRSNKRSNIEQGRKRNGKVVRFETLSNNHALFQRSWRRGLEFLSWGLMMHASYLAIFEWGHWIASCYEILAVISFFFTRQYLHTAETFEFLCAAAFAIIQLMTMFWIIHFTEHIELDKLKTSVLPLGTIYFCITWFSVVIMKKLIHGMKNMETKFVRKTN